MATKSIACGAQAFINGTQGQEANRTYGSRILMPGLYEFDSDAQVTAEKSLYRGNEVWTVEITSKNGQKVNIASLLRQTVTEDGKSTEYINKDFADGASLASDFVKKLANHKITIGNEPKEVYSMYSTNGDSLDTPRKTGRKCFPITKYE